MLRASDLRYIFHVHISVLQIKPVLTLEAFRFAQQTREESWTGKVTGLYSGHASECINPYPRTYTVTQVLQGSSYVGNKGRPLSLGQNIFSRAGNIAAPPPPADAKAPDSEEWVAQRSQGILYNSTAVFGRTFSLYSQHNLLGLL